MTSLRTSAPRRALPAGRGLCQWTPAHQGELHVISNPWHHSQCQRYVKDCLRPTLLFSSL